MLYVVSADRAKQFFLFAPVETSNGARRLSVHARMQTTKSRLQHKVSVQQSFHEPVQLSSREEVNDDLPSATALHNIYPSSEPFLQPLLDVGCRRLSP